MFETMPTSQPPKKESLPPEELFGSNIFEVEGGELKRVSEDIEKPPAPKKEIPKEIEEEAKRYAKAKSFFARNKKEADQIEQEAIQEFYKLKSKDIERLQKLEEKKKKEAEAKEELKEEIIELTEEVK